MARCCAGKASCSRGSPAGCGASAECLGRFALTCCAFDTWAANHPRLNFKDVTEACVEEAGDNCAAAEVFIVPSVVAGPSGSADLAAYVRPTLETIDRKPILTSGRAVDGLGLPSPSV